MRKKTALPILVFSAVIFCICTGVLGIKGVQYATSRRAYEAYQREAKCEDVQGAEPEKQTNRPIHWEAFAGMDVVAWLSLDDLSYPVCQDNSNAFYLHHLPDGSYNFGGSIFLDTNNDASLSDANSVIYGHNMSDGSMFGSLEERFVKKPCPNHTFSLFLPDGTRHLYQVSSVQITKENAKAYQTSFPTVGDFVAYQNEMAKDSLYANDQDIKEKNHMVTLSTCYGSAGTDRRLLIQGREVAVEQVQAAVPDAFYKKNSMKQRRK